MDFFRINAEKKIGFKRLTNADLGLSKSSNQTHIGLYQRQGMLSFLKDEDITNSILIYNNNFEILPCLFDRIENSNGTFRSPKIKLGDNEEPSVARKIREIVNNDPTKVYYLLWFGLDNDDLFFWLFDNNSEDFKIISKYLPKENKVYSVSQIKFSALLIYIHQKINTVSIDYQEEMEIAVQKQIEPGKYRNKDINTTKQYLAKIGRSGEELIDNYLSVKRINHEWMNKSRESGDPFDFIIYSNKNEQKFVDVKSTPNAFDLPIFFSKSELSFINTVNEKEYSVYRVFEMNNSNKKFRICNNCFHYVNKLINRIDIFNSEIKSNNANLQDLTISFEPSSESFKSISDDILLEGI